ncbi:ABC transporter permease [Cuneatibacter caecimuris]|uniref:Peptide/nickel transport system permease protein n=1 Tax=Cuneatibacter caecimuris TaxID=1796618 RepID=A0A4Q7PNG9_9FIRM|nr:ABC transporter permease [Cuneatibacter caecimuris]RZT02343.1 peptide/nickel transport system permease protein [Cuneatibacter caecimuris]
MRQYIIRRILISVLVLLGVSFLIYGMLRIMPSDFVDQLTAGNPKITSEQKEALKEAYGLNTGILEGYVNWLGDALHGDFGTSFTYRKPVTEVLFSSKLWVSFTLSAIAFVIELIIAIPLGIIAARKQYSKTDYAIVFCALAGLSLPSFFFAAVLRRVFSIGLGWLPLSGMVTAKQNFTGLAHIADMGMHFILPIVVFVILGVGSWLRYVRTNMLEVLNADYVRTARAKGLSEHKVIYKHAFRNTLIPIVTFIGGSIPGLFSGAIITESIFSIDGIGKAAIDAVHTNDIPFLMAYMMFLAVLTILGTLISDVLYAVVDPRVRYN